MRILRVSSCFCLQDPLLFLGKKIPSYYQPTETFMRGWRKEKEMKRARKKKKKALRRAGILPLFPPLEKKERGRERMVQTIRFFSPPSFSSSSSFALGGAFLSSCHFFLEGRKILWRHQTPPTTLPFKNKQRSVTKSESLFLFLWPEMKFPVPFFHCPGATAVSSARGGRG